MEKRRMLILVLTLLALHSFQAYSDEWLSIDCGATTTSVDDITGLTWETDENYIGTGENKLLSTATNLPQMKTLRIFPNGSNNCYNLPLRAQSKFLVRAGFYYGNYDNLQNPPTFRLRIQNGELEVNVATSLDFDPIFHEFILTTRGNDVVDVCLVRTQDNQVPFISTLEATLVDQKAYRLMTNDVSLYLQSRINYGVNRSVPDRFNTLVEMYNRIWTPQEVPMYRNLFNGIGPLISTVEENNPPDVVLNSAIEANDVSESIVIPIDFREKSQVITTYLVLYFDILPAYQLGEVTRSITISIDGQVLNTTQLPGILHGEVVSIYPLKVAGGTANLTISPAQGTTSPVLLNAMEVFSVIDTSKASKTSAASLLGISPLVLFSFLGLIFNFCVVCLY